MYSKLYNDLLSHYLNRLIYKPRYYIIFKADRLFICLFFLYISTTFFCKQFYIMFIIVNKHIIKNVLLINE